MPRHLSFLLGYLIGILINTLDAFTIKFIKEIPDIILVFGLFPTIMVIFVLELKNYADKQKEEENYG